ncbi:hypothetical protein HPP92_028987, partial [Vanilla planifolia]
FLSPIIGYARNEIPNAAFIIPVDPVKIVALPSIRRKGCRLWLNVETPSCPHPLPPSRARGLTALVPNLESQIAKAASKPSLLPDSPSATRSQSKIEFTWDEDPAIGTIVGGRYDGIDFNLEDRLEIVVSGGTAQ